VSKKRKRFAFVGALIALALLAGGIVAACGASSEKAALSSRKGDFPRQVRKSFLAGCEGGKTGNSPLCQCLLVKTEANYTTAEIQKLEADAKRGASAPSRFRQLFLECYAPKGNWTVEAQNRFVSNCSRGRLDRVSGCRCLVRKVEAGYSGAEVQAAEAAHDARYISLKNEWSAECFRRP
jgi:hypothetical protein